MEQKEPLQLYNLVGRQNSTVITDNSLEVPQNIKPDPLYDPAILFLGIYWKEMKLAYQRDICTSMFPAALLTIAKTKPNLDVYQLMNGYRMSGIYTQWNIIHV